VYNTQLLIRYSAAIKEALTQYGESVIYDNLNHGIKVNRRIFKELIESGYLLPNYKKNVFTINPMLTYRAEYMRPKDYKEVCVKYDLLYDHLKIPYINEWRDENICIFCRRYSGIVAGYMKKKKL